MSQPKPELEEQVQTALKKTGRQVRTAGKREDHSRPEAKNARKKQEKIDQIYRKYTAAHSQQKYEAFPAVSQDDAARDEAGKELVRDIKEKQALLDQLEAQIAEYCVITPGKSEIVFEQIDLLNKFGYKAVQGFFPQSAIAVKLKSLCKAAKDDFVIGMIDTSFCENGKRGIIITDKGLYASRYRAWSIWESCLLFICGFYLSSLPAWQWFVSAVIAAGVLLFFLRKLVIMVRKFFSGDKRNYVFIPWEQTEIYCDGLFYTIQLKPQYQFKLSLFSELSKARVALADLLNKIAELKKEMDI